MPNAQSHPNAKIDTPIGPIFIYANGLKTAIVSAPQVMIDGLAMSVSAVLVSSDGLNFDFIKQIVPADQNSPLRFEYAPDALKGTLANGQAVDLVALGKLAAVIGPTVRQFAANERRFFLDAERRALLDSIAGLESEIARYQKRVEEKRRELAAIESQLAPPPTPTIASI
jgi:hypothetical protein